MSNLVTAIPSVRRSTVAVLRVHPKSARSGGGGKARPVQVQFSFGSGFCIAEDRLVMTAHHTLNKGLPRDEQDRFHVLVVPDNGELAYHFPVVGFPLELPECDLAVLELGPCSTPDIHLPALPVILDPVPDGTAVATVGYPSPEIGGVKVDADLNYRGGQFFLKSHANEGIVAGQYELGGNRMYELNVGWHHGESGGPIATVGPHPAVFSIMQHYRNVQSPHGVVAGPHRGVALSCVSSELAALGIEGVGA
ncbi:MAG: trypsin-like peptidase domain-containing protein [Coriobacteriia bacterium]|nr:trypsin-like peptidase domain-containing protein [Coriobacteriia bacterium]